MPNPTVKIRMYKQGLGDCFLLTFPRSDGTNFYTLIDCGAITGTNSAKVVEAVKDIQDTTKGHLDLLVGTHEHWDHLSGFNQARDLFNQFTVSNVWLAWTEDVSNPDIQKLVKKRGDKVAALRMAMTRMSPAVDSQVVQSIRQVLSFFGEDDGTGNGAGLRATGGNTTADAMQYLRALKVAKVRYCNPSTETAPIPLDGVDGVRVYVFGPPTDQKLLKQDLPSKKGQETYGMTSKPAEDCFFAAISPAADSQEAESTDYSLFQPQAFPFDEFYRVSQDEAKDSQGNSFFREHYGFDKGDAEHWRCIDEDWLNLTSELALNLDSDTNNTSLVLAFELGEPGSGKVLLFAADAQVGNWLSWGTLSWTLKNPDQPDRTLKAADLLKNVVFYKVGHHGSHNATLRAQGLELMTSSELVAMIPVVEKAAEAKGWEAMPFDVLLNTLKTKTKGRVARIDTGVPKREDAPNLTDAEWQNYSQRIVETPLYIEYTVE